ncbi:MAG: hypothetical protein KAS90_05350 [Candidatus Aenigmarchaeota archaeon]|nr:hypothetical protein [Candidatus Aenigmarchaeota archaeon]
MKRKLPEEKLAGQWFIATLLVSAAMWIGINIEWVLGVTSSSYYGALFLAFLFNAVAGLIYIAITVEVAKDL